jgi:hypothetical protein
MKIGYSLLFFLIVSLSAPSLAQSKGGKPAGGPTTTELRGWRNTEWGMSSPDVLKLNPSFVIMPLEADNTRKVSGKIDIVACPFEFTSISFVLQRPRRWHRQPVTTCDGYRTNPHLRGIFN